MNKEINQKISQFLDDELDHAELDNFLHNIKKQPDLKSKINRYQAVTQVLKMDQAVLADGGFLEGINQQLKDEPHYFLPQQRAEKRTPKFWQKTSLAIAASATFVAIILAQQSGVQSIDPIQQIAEVHKQVVERPVQVAKASEPTQHERLKAYLQAHNDDLYTHGSSNIHPFARVASYGRD